MADVTVSALAATVGASVERLLAQMQEAGLPQQTADATVTDEEKQTLLVYLKGLHGEQAQAPKKITLRRKSISTLKASGSGKSVNVEVRKKRVYVKRDTAVSVDQASKPASANTAPGSLQINLEDAEAKRLNAIDARRREERIAKLAAEEAAKSKQAKAEADEAQSRKVKSGASNDAALPVDIDGIATKQGKKRSKHDEDADDRPKKKKLVKASRKTKVEELIEEDEDAGPSKPRLTSSSIVVKLSNKHVFEKPTKQAVYNVEIGETIVIADLARQMSLKAGTVIKVLMNMGVMATINDSIDQDSAMLAVEELGHTASVKKPEAEAVEEELRAALAIEGTIEKRAPVVTVMGHVDHGKTSLLDYIRNSKVAAGEAGGITQHIGAYHVETSHGMITFLDTPGHAAFTAMRSRGAQATDVVILVVAADDGVMPQTEEAIQHAKSAGVPVIVAINKIDKEGADPERVTSELAAKDLVPEGWGGDTQFVSVSAITGEGIDELLEAILLQAELLELAAPADVPAQGLIIEARIEKGRGVVATALIQAGTLRNGDFVLAGQSVGKIKAMTDEAGASITEAGPAIPVEILGLDSPPSAGDEFAVIQDERKARELANLRKQTSRQEKVARQQESQLENMFAAFEGPGAKILPILIKTDVRGSLEAILSALADFNTDEVAVKIISSGVGGLNESDINLAVSTDAVVLGFNVRAEATARRRAEEEGIEIRYYSVIYNLLDEIKKSLSGMLEPEMREKIVGIAEVRDVFRSPKFGQIAGCMIVEGTVFRDKPIRVLRDNVVIYQGELESLRRFKDDVANVRSGVECGIGVKDYNDVKNGDQIEVYEIEHIAREL